MSNRPLYVIAREIRADWKKPSAYAVPYIDAMASLGSVEDAYYFDSGREIVLRFLCNSAGWRGDVARQIKAELKAL